MIPKKLEGAILLAAVFCAAGTVIWIRTSSVRATYEFVRQERALKNLEEENQTLRIQLGKLTAPKKLEALSGKLGLAAPKLAQTLKFVEPSPSRTTLVSR